MRHSASMSLNKDDVPAPNFVLADLDNIFQNGGGGLTKNIMVMVLWVLISLYFPW